jgi:hypothetical protein
LETRFGLQNACGPVDGMNPVKLPKQWQKQ